MPTVTADDTYYVDLGDDPDFTPGSFTSVYPEAPCQWSDEIRGIGELAFTLSLSALDQDGNPSVSGPDFIGPYRSYFRLRFGNTAIMAGPVVSTHIKRGDDYMSIAGKTWEHIFEKWEYPFDGRTHPPADVDHTGDFRFPNTFVGNEIAASGAVTPAGLAYQANNRDVVYILSDLFSMIMNGVGHRLIFDISLLATLSGIQTNYQFSLGDDTKFFSIIDDLFNNGQGIDWWISHDRKFWWASPYRFGNPATPSISLTVDSSIDPDNLEFGNNGVIATHVQGKGSGLASQTTLARAVGYGPGQVQFSRLDATYDFGDVRNSDQLLTKTQRQLSHDLNPEHDIPLSLDPAKVSGFWGLLRKGRAIWIDYDLVFHHINSLQQIKSYEATLDNERNAMVDFSLQQIYDLSLNAGTLEG